MEEAKDVFHDALVAYYEKTRTGPLALPYSDKSYLLGIVKHLWHMRYWQLLGLGIYDTMQYIQPKVATICTGTALSMSAVLLCAGAAGKRAALKHSRIMIHQPSGGTQGTAADIEISAREIMKAQKELYDIIAQHSRQEYKKVHAASARDYWMTATEGKEFGMIDEVLLAERPQPPL